jgi:hypothetical protein
MHYTPRPSTNPTPQTGLPETSTPIARRAALSTEVQHKEVSVLLNSGRSIELGWSRADCVRYLTSLGLANTPKSSCLGCPFHGNAQWRHIRDTSPEEWADVVAFDSAIRKRNARANATGNQLLGEASLHRSRVPLDQAPIDHVTAAEWAALQQEFGTAAPEADKLEQGELDGCSPWACRGSEAEPVQGDFGLAS